MSALQEIPVKTIDGKPSSLKDFAGQVLLVVNVASKCGLTPQYDALEPLYEKYRAQGFAVLGFPANDFGAQEPGTDAEIGQFCRTSYGVKFPMFSKIAVTGAEQHPLYRSLVAAQPTAMQKAGSDFRGKLAGYGIKPKNEIDVLWNFEKFLVGRSGEPVARFAPDVTPDDPMVVNAIEAELKR
jgi:glutathione peroxidase